MDVAVLWSLNIRTVLVHGAAAQIQALAERRSAEPSDLEGSGVTDAETLQLALTAANRLTHEILEGLSAADLRGASTNAVIAHPAGHPARGRPPVHRPRRAHRRRSCCRRCWPTASCRWCRRWAWTATGRTYRVNSDAVALEMAKALGAVKLVYITTADGLVVGGTLARQLSVDELAEALQKGTVARRPALEGAPRGGGLPGGRAPRARDQRPGRRGPAGRGLLERGHRHPGLRQRVPADPPRPQARRAQHRSSSSRPRWRARSCCRARAPPSSASSTTTTSSRSTGTRWPASPCTSTPARTRASWPACACGPSHENQGIGRRMVQFVEDRAREMGLETLFALSTQAFNFFQSKAGFAEGTPGRPAARAPRALRAERPALEGPGQAALNLQGQRCDASPDPIDARLCIDVDARGL